jgi:hypothetical protein
VPSVHKGPSGEPVLQSNITRRIDFALFMVEALTDAELVHEAPVIVGRHTPWARQLTRCSHRTCGDCPRGRERVAAENGE